MPNTSPNYLANGNIFPSTIVMMDTSVTTGNNVIQATANGRGVGVAQAGSRTAPTPDVTTPWAAIQGDPITVFGDGDECLVLLGGAVAVGDLVVASGPVSGLGFTQVYFDSVAFTLPSTLTGLAVKIGTEIPGGGLQNVVGRMLEGGADGEFRRMQVQLFQASVSTT